MSAVHVVRYETTACGRYSGVVYAERLFLQNSRRQIHYHSIKRFLIVCSMNIEVFVVALINDSSCFGQ